MMHYPHLVWIMAMVIWALGGCETDRDAVSVLESSRMEFDDLFIFEDSIRLDPAVLLGRITHLDVSSSNELLVSDELGQGVYLFSLTGALLSEMVIDECAPEADGFSVNSAVFASDDCIVAIDGSRGYVFDRDGNCLVSKEYFDFLTTQAICAQGDTNR